MTGHAQGAAGALEAIFCLLMLKDDFISPSINVENTRPRAEARGDRDLHGRRLQASTR